MTAEVAILNKIGVALAADSTVTITTQGGDKTYNTTNKLFTLSKHHPIGIMIWNGMLLNSVPMELIIKEFRESLGTKSKKTVAEYSAAFIKHLKTRSHVTKADQAANFQNIMIDFCRSIKDQFLEDCHAQNVPVTEPKLTGECSKSFSDCLDRFERMIATCGRNENFKGVSANALEKNYPSRTTKVVKSIFAMMEPTRAQTKRFVKLLHQAAVANISSDDFTGIVIAGYGSREHYPQIVSHKMDGIFANRLKIFETRKSAISRDCSAVVAPFARREAANLFMEGVDYDYQQEVNESATKLIIGLADLSAQFYGIADKKKIAKLKESLAKTADYYLTRLHKMRISEANKVLEAIQFLDKPEMAILAENIVSLTALKQKVSLETETVGGSIDVAFLSKNDGFVWIKRKHYFDKDLNPFFFERYLSGTGVRQ